MVPTNHNKRAFTTKILIEFYFDLHFVLWNIEQLTVITITGKAEDISMSYGDRDKEWMQRNLMQKYLENTIHSSKEFISNFDINFHHNLRIFLLHKFFA